MTTAVTRSAAFLLGFGFALLPAVGPFLALLLFISARLRVRRSDLIWVGAALLFGLAPLVTGKIDMFLSSSLQFAAGWLIYRAFAELRPPRNDTVHPSLMGAGLLAGLALIVGLNLLEVRAWNFDTAKTIAQAIVWQSSPALFGHAVLVLGGLIAVVAPTWHVRLGALGLSAVGVLVSGSREAAIGWVLIAVVLQFTGSKRSWRNRAWELAFVAIMVAISTGLGPQLGWGKVGFLLQPTSQATSGNLLQGTELPSGDWWDTSWVTVSTFPAEIAGEEVVGYRVRKIGEHGWQRLQQAVEIKPATTYTVSSWILADASATRPGIQGWGQYRHEDEVRSFVLSGSLTDGRWLVNISGAGTLLDAGVAQQEGAWVRVFATFRFDGAEPLAWFVGLAPDNRTSQRGEAAFAAFQLERGELGPYQPGTATRGLGLGVARVPYWQAAAHGIAQRPLLGWDASAFPEFFLQSWPGRSRLQIVPAHAHSLFLQTWFERGIFGLVGLMLFIAALAGPALSRGDIPLLAVLGAIMFANVFDTTLLYGGVFYPLLAAAGWRAGALAAPSPERTTTARRIATRLMLAVADTSAAAIAFLLAFQTAAAALPLIGSELATSGVPPAAFYALLLWPALAWQAGLYPGYGLTPPQELKKHIFACMYAGLLLTTATVFFSTALPLAVPVLLLTVAFSFVTLPIGRAVTKRMLHALELWGRPVIVMGAGDTGLRIARALLRTPLDGLHPVALFDDDPALRGRTFHGVRVRGTLLDADAFAARHDIVHAIVAIPKLASSSLRDVLDTKGRHFRIVQYVPDLAGLPAEDVFASSLDGMLALEVRNNLSSLRNRFVKRAIDVVGGVLGLVLLSPILLVFAAWVRIDSRGPVLHRSPRIGQDGKAFSCLKFRSMVMDAEERLVDLMAKDTAIREEYQRFHKLADDPRTTAVGRFLRTYSLDELPQLFNVVTGQMSLVGPRPYLIRELPLMDERGDVILTAKPGMTGFWQVSKRNDVSFEDRLEMEAHYVRNWSIWWDIVILARTLPAILEKRGK